MAATHTGRALLAALALGAFGSCGADSGVTPGPDPPRARTIPVTVGGRVVHAELATTWAERDKGLMGRTALPDTAGMLFVFAADQTLSFWMRGTPINLAIAFLDSSRTILNIEEMVAHDELTFHRSAGLARYALEMRSGWFAERGIGPGAKVTFTLPPGLVIDP